MTSVNMKVPMKTNAAPRQWDAVNGFWKYRMDSIRLMNLRSVTTSVTVKALHSVVRMNTERIQMYLSDGQGKTHNSHLTVQEKHITAI